MRYRAINPFADGELRAWFASTVEELEEEIDSLSNDALRANSHDYLVEYFWEKYSFEPIKIGDEDISMRQQERCKITKYHSPQDRLFYGHESIDIDGIRVVFCFPYEGEPDLFEVRPSIFITSGYPEIGISDTHICFELEYEVYTNQCAPSAEKVLKELEGLKSDILRGVGYVNKDVKAFNASLGEVIKKALAKREDYALKYEGLEKALEIPLPKSQAVSKIVSLEKRRPLKLSSAGQQEPNWCLGESEYVEVLSMIKNFYSTCERTPATYAFLDEEELRNLSLANLNTIYQGRAGGETFRNKGKTDISIEVENRSAFVAECKMWTGEKNLLGAISQLLGYLTWRDVKTALIVFSRNKQFPRVLENARTALGKHPNFRALKELDKNEFDC